MAAAPASSILSLLKACLAITYEYDKQPPSLPVFPCPTYSFIGEPHKALSNPPPPSVVDLPPHPSPPRDLGFLPHEPHAAWNRNCKLVVMSTYTGVTRGAQVTGVAVCALCLTWISTVLRAYVRFRILKFFGREDWLTMAAMIVFTVFCSLGLGATTYGLGAHMQNISPVSLETGFEIIFVCELLYVVATTVTKVAIAAYFLRLSSKQYQRLTIYITLAFVFLFSTMYFFFLLFQCSPISFLWVGYNEGTGTCIQQPILTGITYAHCAMSALTDWSFGILPIFFVWNVRMNPRTKFSVVLILSLGFFASTATIVRIVYIKRLAGTKDYSWEGINLVKWSMVEPAIAITAMNIATLRPLFKNFLFRASKRFDSTADDSDMSTFRPSGDSRNRLRRRPTSGNVLEYSVEFAELLGLARIGVTTHISAGGSNPEKEQMWRRFRLRQTNSQKMSPATQKRHDSNPDLDLVLKGRKIESLVELSKMPTSPLSDGNWSAGIVTKTVITRDVNG